MNKPHGFKEHDDDDIAQVFDAQRITAPANLRQSILEQANVEAKKPRNPGAADEHGSRITRTPKGIAAFTQKQGALSAAIAASIVVLIIGVPLTFDAPEPDIAQTMDAQSAETQSIQAESDSARMARAPAQADETNQSAEAASLAVEPAETLRMTDQKFSADIAADTVQNESTNAKHTPAYRQTASTWINQIKVLIADGQPVKAKEEYTLLEQQFPEEAKDYQPDFSRRITEIPDENADRIDGARH